MPITTDRSAAHDRPAILGLMDEARGLDLSDDLDDETDEERADPFHDQYEGTPRDLTPEDETLLGVDPYDAPAKPRD